METATTAAGFAILAGFGAILSYPGESYRREAAACQNAAAQIDLEAGRCLSQFSDRVSGLTLEEVQELYVQTFDLDPVCALEVGWQLYGDNYDRGNFLVQMRQELERYGVPETLELPDHLSHVLPLLARLDHREASRFAAASVIPALKKMLAAFEGKESPYGSVLKALSHVLESAVDHSAAEVNRG